MLRVYPLGNPICTDLLAGQLHLINLKPVIPVKTGIHKLDPRIPKDGKDTYRIPTYVGMTIFCEFI